MESKAVIGLVSIFLVGIVEGQPAIQLKNRAIQPTGQNPSSIVSPFASLTSDSPQRIHLLVQFPGAPGEDERQKLEARGARVLSYVPANSFMISIDAMLPLDDLGLVWSGPLEAIDKISGLLTDTQNSVPAVVEFHADADMAAARSLILASGAELRESPDAAPWHLMMSATLAQVQWLASQDAVAYIFPASDELVAGQPVVACASALTAFGAAGQYTAVSGDGWDGPGLGSAALTYSWSANTTQLPADAAHGEIVRAFGEWAKAVNVTFIESPNTGSSHNINVLFGRLNHGDAYPFDGPGGVLAHTFYPAPPNPEPLAGDMHFDDDEHWRIGADTDLFSVALHEAGHALGLGHSDNPQAVMYPYYKRVSGLNADDITVIRTLYAAPGTASALTLTLNVVPASTSASTIALTGSATGGSGQLTVTASSDRGWTAMASTASAFRLTATLANGPNVITVVALDGAATQVTKVVTINRQAAATTPMMMQITSPAADSTYSTRLSSITIGGIAAHSSGIRSVNWSSSAGSAGAASGTTSWNTGTVALANGMNTITVTATAMDGTTGSATLIVNAQTAGVVDTTAPTLTITSPAMLLSTTSASTIIVQGTATDNVGVTKVIWVTGTGASGNATGTSRWQTSAIPLYSGYNTIVIRAYDAAGNMAWRSLQVTRR